MRRGSHLKRPHGQLVFRGSRKRIARIKWRGNSSHEFWIFLVLLVLLVVVVIPWMMKQSAELPHQSAPAQHPPTP
jgi:hypothetical protein